MLRIVDAQSLFFELREEYFLNSIVIKGENAEGWIGWTLKEKRWLLDRTTDLFHRVSELNGEIQDYCRNRTI